MVSPEKSDTNQCGDVRADRSLGRFLWKWKGLWFAAGLSLLVEVLQLITSRGLLEFDDVLHNMIGAVVGVGIVMVVGKKLK